MIREAPHRRPSFGGIEGPSSRQNQAEYEEQISKGLFKDFAEVKCSSGSRTFHSIKRHSVAGRMAARRKATPKRTTPNRRHRSEPEPLARALGHKIRSIRKEKEISFDALVGLSELGRGYVSELERGLAVPSIVTLHKIAEALEVSVVDLVHGVCPISPLRAELIELSAAIPRTKLERLVGLAKKMAQNDDG